MSVIVASGESISKNILNHSLSKQMYSFPKAERFQSLKKSSSATFLYNIPSMMSTRKTFIGYGKKYDFTKEKKPNAPYYNVARIFETPHPTAPKYTFGIARDYYKKVVVNNEVSTPQKLSPGPARYSYLKPFGSEAPKYTMNKRYPLKALQGAVNSPGPARYTNNLNINCEGRYTLSRFTNTPRAGWSLSKVQRFKYDYPKTPGANAYHLEEMINGTGSIYNSRFQSACGKTMSAKFRSTFDTGSITPGPGSYQTFSEFGIYRAKNADEFDKKVSQTFYRNNTKKKSEPSKRHSRSQSTIDIKPKPTLKSN